MDPFKPFKFKWLEARIQMIKMKFEAESVRTQSPAKVTGSIRIYLKKVEGETA